MEKLGFIQIHRKLLDWEWYDDINTKVLFLHLLLKANYKPKNWRGIEIKEGEFITSLQNLANETGLSIQQVRTGINKLKSTQEITYKSHASYSLIKLNNYNKYQCINTADNKPITNEQQTNNKRVTTTNKDNNINKENKDNNYFENQLLNEKFLDFINHRKEIKKPLKDTGINSNVLKIKKWLNDYSIDNIIMFIDKAISNGYQGIFEDEKLKNNNNLIYKI